MCNSKIILKKTLLKPFIMKKARIFLTAIAVFAVVGGAMAFKAVRTTTTFYCSNPFNPTVCDLPVPAMSTLAGADGLKVRCSIIQSFNNDQNCVIWLRNSP